MRSDVVVAISGEALIDIYWGNVKSKSHLVRCWGDLSCPFDFW